MKRPLLLRVTRALPLVPLLVGLSLSACDGCGEPVAVLRSGDATVEGALSGADWREIAASQEFHLEDAVRTGGASSARVHLVGGGDLRLGEHTMLVFHPGQAEAFSTLVEVETGEVVIESSDGPMQLLTEFGNLVLMRGSEARVRAGDAEAHIHISIGRATIESLEGETLDLGVLDTVMIGPDGTTRVETAEAEPEPEPVPQPDPEPEPEPESNSVSVAVFGSGVRVRREAGASLERLEEGGASLPRGATLTVPRRARVTATSGNARVSARGRAAATVPESGLLSIEIGAAELMTDGDPVAMEIPGGVVRSSGNAPAAATLEVGRRGTKIAVRTGRIAVDTAHGSQELRAGDAVQVSRRGVITDEERAPTVADLTLTAGESATIHDGQPPTTVRLTIAGCAQTVVAVVGGRRFEGEGGAIIPVRGTARYEARCGEGSAVTGTLRTRRDSGRAPLLRSAPHTRVDADGRTYRVHYQNLLPEVEVRWRDAEGSHRLEVESSGRPRTLDLASPQHTFSSGELRDGRHRFRFVGSNGESPWGTIVIAFDNAAPTVYVREPADGTLAAGSSSTVSGQLLEGFTASVDGTALALDGQGRFSTEATLPTDGRALSIRTAHPSHGVHYYLRHASGGSD